MTVVVFDMDDTLFPEHAYARSGLAHVGAFLETEHGVQDAAARLLAVLETGVRGRIFNVILEEEGMGTELIPELVRRYRHHSPRISLYPEAPGVLDQLKGNSPLALITDGPKVCQRAKIAALALERWFDPILVTDEAGREHWKPHPWAYQTVEAHFGVAGHACVYIGDNPTKDFVTARARGWNTVRVDRGDRLNPCEVPDEAHEAAHVVADLSYLPALLSG